LDLRSHSSDGVFGNLQARNFGSYLKNVFTDVTAHEAKVHSPHSRNVNLYFNTIYYGMDFSLFKDALLPGPASRGELRM
jgi:hypothetical protein